MNILKKTVALVLCLLMLQSIVISDYAFTLGLGLTTQANAVSQAQLIADIAYAETKVGAPDNPNKYTDWFGVSTSWCAIFVSWCAYKAGVPQSVIAKTASAKVNSFGTPYFAYTANCDVKVGDIIYCSNNVTSSHVGIVYDVDSTYIYTAEGNMSDTVRAYKYRRSDGYISWSSSRQWQRINYIGRPNYEGDKTAPVIKNVAYSDVSYDGYTVTCNVSDNVGVTRVAFPTWAQVNGTSTRKWSNGTVSNGVATFRVNTSAHSYASGVYTTQIYAYDEAGNISSASVNVNVPEVERVAETFFGGHTYVLYNAAMTYDEAKEYCERLGGTLFVITGDSENKAVSSLMSGSEKSFWAGATDSLSENTWVWVTGEEFSYESWGTGQPDNRAGEEDCLAVYGTSWRDAKSSERLGFICELNNGTLSKPTELTVSSRTTSSVFLRWKTVTGATGYRVYRYSAQEGKYVKYADVTSNYCNVIGLNSGAGYRFFVKAFQTANGKTYWGENSEFLTAASSPAAVTALRATSQTTNSITLQWNAVANASGYYVYKYDATSGKYVITKTLGNGTLKYTVTGLSAATTAKFFVRAYKTDDVSTHTGYASNYLTTSTLPGKVTGLSAVSTTTNSVSFKWNAVAGATAYRIYLYNKATNSYTPCATVTGKTNITLSSLAGKSSYNVCVSAIRTIGTNDFWGAKSELLTLKTK